MEAFMSGDSKIGPVGGVGRAVPLRRVASDNVAAMRTPAQLQTAQETLPAAQMKRLAGILADQDPPVGRARVRTCSALCWAHWWSVCVYSVGSLALNKKN